MTTATLNGGFPVPPDGELVREVTSRHHACAAQTRIRLPRELGPRIVRRVICAGCSEAYEATRVTDCPQDSARDPSVRSFGGRFRAPRLRAPSLAGARINFPTAPRLDWRLLTLPAAALAVFVVLSNLQGSEPSVSTAADDPVAPAPPAMSATKEGSSAPAESRRDRSAVAAGGASLITENSFSVALPKGWERVSPSGGATFAAIGPGGEADVTLWVKRDPKLDFPLFEATSLAQLETLAGSAEVVERNVGADIAQSSIKIAPAQAPAGAPDYEVLLRGTGKNWYYLATTVMPDAPKKAAKGVALIQGSFIPTGGGRG